MGRVIWYDDLSMVVMGMERCSHGPLYNYAYMYILTN